MRSLATLAILCALAGPAGADRPGSSIAGIVVDELTGAPILDAAVVVTGPALPAPKTVVTDESGSYFVDVPPGSYAVVVLFGEARSESRSVVVAAGKTTPLDARLDVSGTTS